MPTPDEATWYKPTIDEINKLQEAGYKLDIKPNGSVEIKGLGILTEDTKTHLLQIVNGLQKACQNYIPDMPFVSRCDYLRATILEVGKDVLSLKKHKDIDIDFPEKVEPLGEIMANIMLAYRHLEDARMRIGKVIQAYEGGTSKYDRFEYCNIWVNNIPIQWTAKEISYEEIIRLAGLESDGNLEVKYTHGAFFDKAGEIPKEYGEKKKVHLVDGMVFTVQPKNK